MYRYTNKAFTLLELLVVIVLLGIITSFAVLAMGSSSAERKMEEEAKRLHALIRLVQEEAIIHAKEIALEINKQEYSFLEYKDKEWLPLTSKVFRTRTINPELELSVDTEAQSKIFKSEKTNVLRIYFLSSGEQTPFEMRLNVKNEPQPYYKLAGYFSGKLNLEHSNENEI